MRSRKVSFRYAEVVGGLSEVLETEVWGLLRLQPMASPLFRPPADVIETATAYYVTIELPGIADDEMEIFVHPDALVVSGRRRCRDVTDAHYHAAEIRYGPFRFDMSLPYDADADRIEAVTDRGLTRIVIPKRPGGTV